MFKVINLTVKTLIFLMLLLVLPFVILVVLASAKSFKDLVEETIEMLMIPYRYL